MYDKLVRLLKDRAECFDYDGWVDTAILMSQAADAIEERCQQVDKFAEEAARLYAKQPKWIPVTERKPKTDDIVVVAIHDDSGDTPYDRTDIGFYLDAQSVGVWVVGNERCNYITHWMPLPSTEGLDEI
jgi:hypothetical protein